MGKKFKNNGEMLKVFKSSVLAVAKILNKPPHMVRRDEYCSITKINQIPKLNKDFLNDIGGFKNSIQLLFPLGVEEVSTPEVEKTKDYTDEDNISDINAFFCNYVMEKKSLPTLKELQEIMNFNEFDINIKKYFKSIKELLEYSSEGFPELKESLFNETDFTTDYYDNVVNQIKEHKKFIVTTAVSGKKVHEGFFKCLLNYADRNNALILVLPCEDIVNRKTESQWSFDTLLKRYALVVYKDTSLNNNLFISDIRVSAKMLLPTSGISRLSKNKKSMILSSPKQFLEYVPTSNVKMPVAIMSTGAVTVEDYSTEFYMSKRLSKLAEHDHTLGAIVVELEDDEIFHFRQIQYLDDKIVDLGWEYTPNGAANTTKDAVCIFGDSHTLVKDEEVHEKVKDIVLYMNIKDIVLHDIFDGICVSPHTATKPIIKAMDFLDQHSSLKQEGIVVAEYLEDIGSWIDGDVAVVYSNHNNFLQRYLEEGRFIKDSENCYFSLDLAKALIEGEDPLRYLIESKIGISDDISVVWLGADEDYKKYGVQLGAHGHLGANGSKGSAKNIERCYEKSVIGHSHSPCIFRNVFQVGTLSLLKLSYNKGPSSWVQSVCVLYSNGSRQLINIVKDSNGVLRWKA